MATYREAQDSLRAVQDYYFRITREMASMPFQNELQKEKAKLDRWISATSNISLPEETYNNALQVAASIADNLAVIEQKMGVSVGGHSGLVFPEGKIISTPSGGIQINSSSFYSPGPYGVDNLGIPNWLLIIGIGFALYYVLKTSK